MKPVKILFSVFLLYTLGLHAAETENKVIAVVNGTEITAGERPGRAGEDFSAEYESLSKEQKAQLVLSLVNRQLVLEQAREEGFDQTERIREATQALVDSYVVEQYMLRVAAGFDLGEEALLRHYEKLYSNLPEQFRVSHILLDSENSARAALERVESGAGFDMLAQAESLDAVSSARGGDLGWLTRDEMVPAVFDAVSTLSEGEVYRHPVRTQFGWHVLRLLDRRDNTPPPFEEVISRVQQSLVREKTAAYLEKLRSQAAIQILP